MRLFLLLKLNSYLQGQYLKPLIPPFLVFQLYNLTFYEKTLKLLRIINFKYLIKNSANSIPGRLGNQMMAN